MSGNTQIVRWHARGEPVPAGWRLVAKAPAHHARHAVLIEAVRRKVGKSHILDRMPRRQWITSMKLAQRLGRDRPSTRYLLVRAFKRGWVERRRVVCACCASAIFQYRRN